MSGSGHRGMTQRRKAAIFAGSVLHRLRGGGLLGKRAPLLACLGGAEVLQGLELLDELFVLHLQHGDTALQTLHVLLLPAPTFFRGFPGEGRSRGQTQRVWHATRRRAEVKLAKWGHACVPKLEAYVPNSMPNTKPNGVRRGPRVPCASPHGNQ